MSGGGMELTILFKNAMIGASDHRVCSMCL